MAAFLDTPTFAYPYNGLAQTLRDQGFALVTPWSFDTPETQWHTASERRFNLAQATKAALARGHQDGYVRSGSKEMFYFSGTSDSVARSVATHVPTAACVERNRLIGIGQDILHKVNTTVLKRPRGLQGEEGAIKGWFGTGAFRGKECCDTTSSIMTDFKYHEDDRPLRTAAHIDSGLLTVISNPSEIEIRMPDDRWVRPRLSTQTGHAPPLLVLVGFTLERATAGVFCAALHRVHNSGGERRSTVLELRAPPSLVIKPAVIMHSLDEPIKLHHLDESSLAPFLVADHHSRFAQVHTSVNESSPMLPVPSQEGTLAALAAQALPGDQLCSLPFDVFLCVLRALPFTTLASIMR